MGLRRSPEMKTIQGLGREGRWCSWNEMSGTWAEMSWCSRPKWSGQGTASWRDQGSDDLWCVCNPGSDLRVGCVHRKWQNIQILQTKRWSVSYMLPKIDNHMRTASQDKAGLLGPLSTTDPLLRDTRVLSGRRERNQIRRTPYPHSRCSSSPRVTVPFRQTYGP